MFYFLANATICMADSSTLRHSTVVNTSFETAIYSNPVTLAYTFIIMALSAR